MAEDAAGLLTAGERADEVGGVDLESICLFSGSPRRSWC
jgi:hypothetical protein